MVVMMMMMMMMMTKRQVQKTRDQTARMLMFSQSVLLTLTAVKETKGQTSQWKKTVKLL